MKRIVQGVVFFVAVTAVFFISTQSANAASFNFSPAGGSIVQGCTEEVVVMLDTAGITSNAADIEITYDASKIEVLDQDSESSGVQVGTGEAFEAYVYNQVTSGKIKVAAGSFVKSFNGNKIFLKVKFRSLGSATTGQFTINYTGSGDTLDSNIAEHTTSLDKLTSVTNASYTFGSGSCIADTEPPDINFIYPESETTGVQENASIRVDLSDTLSGVDIDSVSVFVNGTEYVNGDPEFSFSGDPSDYQVTVTPAGGIPQGVASTIIVSSDDLAGNSGTRIVTFNIPPGEGGPSADIEPPVILPRNPFEGDTVIEVDENLQINLTDSLSGVDLNSLVLILNGQEYTVDDSEVSFEGDINDYTVTLDPSFMLPDYQLSYLTIFVRDNNGNSKLVTVSFGPEELAELPDTGPPGLTCDCPKSYIPLPDIKMPQTISDIFNELDSIMSDNLTETILPAALLGSGLLLLLANMLAFPGLLSWFWLLLGKRKGKAWGMIFNQQTGLGIKFASVKLYAGKKLITTTRSNRYGEYQLPADQGDYRVEIDHSDYQNQQLNVNIKEKNHVSGQDVGMVLKEGLTESSGQFRFQNITLILNKVFLLAGLTLSLIAVTLSGTFLNFGIFSTFAYFFFYSLID
ncbi:MAG: Ig-like domain-containing protein [Candidatus Dojkabacteria bacterium]